MRYFVEKHNEIFKGKTLEEILLTDIKHFNGISSPQKHFNRTTGRKEHQYYTMDIDGQKRIVAFIQFQDVLDENNLLIGIDRIVKLYSPINRHGVKTAREDYNGIKRKDKLIQRRENIILDIIEQAEQSDYTFFKSLLSQILEYADIELTSWKTTGDATSFHLALDNAPDILNQDIKDLFTGTPFSEVDSLKKVLTVLPANDDLIVDENGDKRTDVKLIDNLKFFIKNPNG